MDNLTNAERLILAFETLPPGSALRINDVIRLVEMMGGSAEAVQRTTHEASLCAYISALAVRYAAGYKWKAVMDPRPNTGHGHVYPRTDGVRARCGGPGFCNECNVDNAIKSNSQPASDGL